MNRASSLSLWVLGVCLQAAFTLLFALTHPVSGEDRFSKGKNVYEKYCIGCHGEKGDGNGMAARDLIIKPRNFTLGLFKFKSTPSGSLPADSDLKNVINNGMPTSSMPNFRLVPDDEKDQVIAYIKGFSERWKKEQPGRKVSEVVVPDFVGSADSVKKGEEIYTERCQRCHGEKGKGPAPTFFLKWDREECEDLTRPVNFNYGVIKRGTRVEDIYQSITTGVEGTPMLSYATLLGESERWHLVSYILNIMGKDRR